MFKQYLASGLVVVLFGLCSTPVWAQGPQGPGIPACAVLSPTNPAPGDDVTATILDVNRDPVDLSNFEKVEFCWDGDVGCVDSRDGTLDTSSGSAVFTITQGMLDAQKFNFDGRGPDLPDGKSFAICNPDVLRNPAYITTADAFAGGGTCNVNLGAVTGGGDGYTGHEAETPGTATNVGVNPDTGALVTPEVFLDEVENPMPDFDPVTFVGNTGEIMEAVDSPFIHSVFLIVEPIIPINFGGGGNPVLFDFGALQVDEEMRTRGHVFSNRTVESTFLVDPPLTAGFGDNQTTFTNGVGQHPSNGITYDLAAMREAYGADAVGSFSAVFGRNTCAESAVDMFVIFSDGEGAVGDTFVQSFPADPGAMDAPNVDVHLPIPASAQYLTLATGAGDGSWLCAATLFGNAAIQGTAPEEPSVDFVRGDANDDRRTDIADAVWIITELFLDGQATTCDDATDANDDGFADSSDVIYIINYQFVDGPAPPAPSLDCGSDATSDSLGCDSSSCP